MSGRVLVDVLLAVCSPHGRHACWLDWVGAQNTGGRKVGMQNPTLKAVCGIALPRLQVLFLCVTSAAYGSMGLMVRRLAGPAMVQRRIAACVAAVQVAAHHALMSGAAKGAPPARP